MIKAIIFDLGNVIVNVNWNNFYRKVASKSDRQLSDKPLNYIEECCKNPLKIRRDFELGKISPKEFYSRISCDLGLKMGFSDFKHAYCSIFSLNRDVADIIKKLRSQYKLILLSNTDEFHFEHIKNKYSIIRMFDSYVLSYKLGHRKPNPLVFIKAIQKAKTAPFNCLYFDDIPEFVFMAKLIGIKAFQYKSFGKLRSDLKRANVLEFGDSAL